MAQSAYSSMYPALPTRANQPLLGSPEEHDGRCADYHHDQYQYQDGREQHHQQRPARGRCVHLPDPYGGQKESVQREDPPDKRYPTRKTRYGGVGNYPEGRPEPGVSRSHHQDDQQVRHERRQEQAHGPRYGGDHQPPQERQKPLVSPGAEQPSYPPGGAQEGKQPDEDDGDLNADQGEHQRTEQASLARKACEEGRRLEYHAPYDVYEAANRIGEVVVPSGSGGSGSHLFTLLRCLCIGGAAPQLYWQAPAHATRVPPCRLHSPECVEG